MLKAQDNSNNLIAILRCVLQPIDLIQFFVSCSNEIRTITIIITATIFKMYAVIINITHYVLSICHDILEWRATKC